MSIKTWQEAVDSLLKLEEYKPVSSHGHQIPEEQFTKQINSNCQNFNTDILGPQILVVLVSLITKSRSLAPHAHHHDESQNVDRHEDVEESASTPPKCISIQSVFRIELYFCKG